MRKKALCAVLSVAMVASMFAACGSDSSSSSSGSASASKSSDSASAGSSSASASDSSSAADSSSSSGSTDSSSSSGDASTWTRKMEAPSTDGWDSSKKIYAYSWDKDFGSKMDIVLEAYPQYKEYYEYVNLGVSGTDGSYQTQIDTLIENGDAKYPSLIPADNDVAKYYSEDLDKVLPMSDIGLTDEMIKDNSYDFAVQYGTYDGKITCVTWQMTPGSVFYSRRIAKDVWGTDDPAEIQKKIATWEDFFKAAEELKAKGYKITSGYEDVKYAIWDTQTQPWVDDNDKVQLDDAVKSYIETAKKMYDNEYSFNTGMWDSTWGANMKDDGKVFCYFGCPWFIGSMKEQGAVEGSWGAVTGPTSYHWGGTYVMVGKDTPNKDLCAFLLYELTCDPDIAVKIVNQTGDAVNNKAAMKRIINGELSKDNAGLKFLGGQNPYEVWATAAETLNLSNVTYSDSIIKKAIDAAVKDYTAGTLTSVEDAMKKATDDAQKALN